jgi:hypothetical protein
MAARWIVMAAALGCLAGCTRSMSPEPSQPYNTGINLRDLMEHVMDPTAAAVWGASGTMVDFEGEHDLSPKTDDEWTKVHDSAMLLVESGNLLLLPGRLQPGRTWTGQAQKLSMLGIEAMRATDARDKAALLRLGGDIHDACEECHRVYVLGEPPKP